ncbi:MAG: hypothetical protein ACI4LX_01180 [Treponema sp.]
MLENENMITVSCPDCGHQFSFSRNVLDFDGGTGAIQFYCTECENIVKICYTGREKEIFVQILH